MKTLLLSIACLLISIMKVSSQSINDFGVNHYKETKTFVMDGYTYQCDVDQGSQFVYIYNKNNKWTYADHIYKDTGKNYAGAASGRAISIIDNPEMTRKVYGIVDNAFTAKMVETFGDYELGIVMYLNPESGKVVEVRFGLTTFNPYAKVPVRIFRSIEVQLKAQISYTPTSIGKRLNYIMLGWGQLPKGDGKIDPIELPPLTRPGGLKPNNNPDKSVVIP